MKPAVEQVFPGFTGRFEGTVPTMYSDILNLVTVARGNMIDPVEVALPLPFGVLADGMRAATEDEIRTEWARVKYGGFSRLGWRAAAASAALALSPEAVDALTISKLRANDRFLSARFSRWEDHPASVQLGVHSMAWACGPAFRFPMFQSALYARDYAACAAQCHMDETGNPGLIPRNAANVALFLAAAAGGDPDAIAWP
jgi:GH24 family phage-related lysozyme (muramidase)